MEEGDDGVIVNVNSNNNDSSGIVHEAAGKSEEIG